MQLISKTAYNTHRKGHPTRTASLTIYFTTSQKLHVNSTNPMRRRLVPKFDHKHLTQDIKGLMRTVSISTSLITSGKKGPTPISRPFFGCTHSRGTDTKNPEMLHYAWCVSVTITSLAYMMMINPNVMSKINHFVLNPFYTCHVVKWQERAQKRKGIIKNVFQWHNDKHFRPFC